MTMYSPHPEISWRLIEDEIVILRLRSLSYYSLEPVGAFLWQKIAERAMTRDELLGALIAEFEVDESTAGPDLDALLAELKREELIVAA